MGWSQKLFLPTAALIMLQGGCRFQSDRDFFCTSSDDCAEGYICVEGSGSAVCLSLEEAPDVLPSCVDRDGDGFAFNCEPYDCDDSDPTISPGSPEVCDGSDNNCDGVVDEILELCGKNEGECVSGERICREGEWGLCSGRGPSQEACDGKDNDCDGEIDEDLVGESCTDPCGIGFMECLLGEWSCSILETYPELCNGVDDDCDGVDDPWDPDAHRACEQAYGMGAICVIQDDLTQCSFP